MKPIVRSAFTATLGIAVLLVVVLASGVGGVGRARVSAQEGTPVATPASEPSCTSNLGIVRSTKTCVNVVHASPDAPPVDVYMNGTVVVAGLAFGSGSGFLEVPAGIYRMQIVASGTTPEAAVIDVPNLELVAARAYEIVAVGLLAEIEVRILDVDVYAVEGSAQFGSARLRVIHAGPDVAAIDVSLIADDIATRPFAGVSFSEASDYAVTAAGTYRLQVAAGDSGDELLFLPEITFERDTVSSLYVMGRAADGTLTIVAVATAASRLPAPGVPEASPAV